MSTTDLGLLPMTRPRVEGRFVVALAVLALLSLLVFAPILDNEFILFDDDRYITDNYHVRSGLTVENMRWALTATAATNWHPLTWWSHMLDAQLYGLNPRGHHLTNLLLHAANALLLLWWLRLATGRLWAGLLVAALFAVHPLHVESVAWTAERKDLLAGFFFMLTLLAYVRHVRRPSVSRYAAVTTMFALGLTAKPMLVTLPLLLLLIDYWPLGRDGHSTSSSPWARGSSGRGWSLLKEKYPLLALSAISSTVTFVVQEHGGAVGPLMTLPLWLRAGNAVLAYGRYLFRTLWPFSLGVFYTHPMFDLRWDLTAVSGIVLAVLTMAFLYATRRPYLGVGWLWFLGSLVPVIGLVQVGAQSMADRYTYLPLIGLFILFAWGLSDHALLRPSLKKPAMLAAAGLVIGLSLLAHRQAGHWRNTFTLFEHTARVTKDNYFALLNLGIAYGKSGQFDRAESVYRETVRLVPEWEEAHFQFGLLLVSKGDLAGAAREQRILLNLDPELAARLQKFILYAGIPGG